MNLSKTLLTAAISACLCTTPAFAAINSSESVDISSRQISEAKRDSTLTGEKIREQDPVKVLEAKKERVQALLKEGKITKEEANEIIAKLDARIKEINEFNKLTLEQKKEKLTRNFKTSLELRKKEGKLTSEEADSALKEFSKMLEKWDGNGYPRFNGKGIKKGKYPCNDCKDK